MVIIMSNYTRVGKLEVESISNNMIPGHPYLQSMLEPFPGGKK